VLGEAVVRQDRFEDLQGGARELRVADAITGPQQPGDAVSRALQIGHASKQQNERACDFAVLAPVAERVEPVHCLGERRGVHQRRGQRGRRDGHVVRAHCVIRAQQLIEHLHRIGGQARRLDADVCTTAARRRKHRRRNANAQEPRRPLARIPHDLLDDVGDPGF